MPSHKVFYWSIVASKATVVRYVVLRESFVIVFLFLLSYAAEFFHLVFECQQEHGSAGLAVRAAGRSRLVD